MKSGPYGDQGLSTVHDKSPSWPVASSEQESAVNHAANGHKPTGAPPIARRPPGQPTRTKVKYIPRYRGRIFLRGPRWWVSFFFLGREYRLSAKNILGRPAESEADAIEALRLAAARMGMARFGLRRSLLDKSAPVAVPSTLRRLLPAPDFEIVGSDIMRGRGPAVYAWLRGNQLLYVGRTARGLTRPLSEHHHQLWPLHPRDRLLMWMYETLEDAERTERLLIAHAAPKLNGVGRGRNGDL